MNQAEEDDPQEEDEEGDKWAALEKMSPEQRRAYFNKIIMPPKTAPTHQKRGGTADLRIRENS